MFALHAHAAHPRARPSKKTGTLQKLIIVWVLSRRSKSHRPFLATEQPSVSQHLQIWGPAIGRVIPYNF